MAETHKHIAIVGGGTAGWLAALMLQKAAENEDGVSISVIESPNIPTVGVGEGSTSVFRQVLLDLEIDEQDFLRETGATLKFGIKHCGWRKDGKDYFGPIDDPSALAGAPPGAPSNWLQHAQIASGKQAAELHLFTALMRRNKSAYAMKKDQLIPLSPYHHAYHFDQAKLGHFLAKRSKEIKHVKTEVIEPLLDSDSGRINALLCTDNQRIPVDFVIDCTGFRRSIIGHLSRDWKSYSDMLPLNKAMPFWIEHDPKNDIAPYTLAQAMDSGWMWGIPVKERLGCGYVFSDVHTTPEQAQLEIETKLKRSIDVRRIIDLNPGRLNVSWVGNCVAFGLAQSFLEPLEATSIHGTLVQLMLLLRHRPKQLVDGVDDKSILAYNECVANQVDDFAQFINVHYAGGRTDTPFWQMMTEDGISDVQKQRLNLWKSKPISRADFNPLPNGFPHVEEQLYLPVLDGLGLMQKSASKQVVININTKRQARQAINSLSSEFGSAAKRAVGHRAFVESL